MWPNAVFSPKLQFNHRLLLIMSSMQLLYFLFCEVKYVYFRAWVKCCIVNHNWKFTWHVGANCEGNNMKDHLIRCSFSFQSAHLSSFTSSWQTWLCFLVCKYDSLANVQFDNLFFHCLLQDAAKYRDELREIGPHSLLKCSSNTTTLVLLLIFLAVICFAASFFC